MPPKAAVEILTHMAVPVLITLRPGLIKLTSEKKIQLVMFQEMLTTNPSHLDFSNIRKTISPNLIPESPMQ
jgi:hypothetical protein